MFPLSFICPKTNRPASAGIETDPDSLRGLLAEDTAGYEVSSL